MATVDDLGINGLLKIGTNVVPATINGCAGAASRALQPIILAYGLSNPVVGYAPSNGAKSGFDYSFDVPYASAAAILNDILTAAGKTIAFQAGTSGGISIPTCIAESLVVSGAEGGVINCRVTTQSVGKVTTGVTVTPPGGSTDVFKFIDATSATLLSGQVRSLFNSFQYTVQGTLVPYRGNSSTGRPVRLKRRNTLCMVTVDYLKEDDLEIDAYNGDPTTECQTPATLTVLLTQACAGSPATLTLAALLAVYPDIPKNSGTIDTFFTETVNAVATKGTFAVS